MFKSIIKSIRSNDAVMRVVHTAWQAFVGVFLLGITGVASSLLSTHNFSDARSALLALAGAAVAAALSAAKGALAAKK